MRPILCAIGFMTRIPLPAVSYAEADVARGAGYFAWVGGLIAPLLWGVAALRGPLGPGTTAVLVTAFWALITGGLHLDGLADTFDGFSGGRGQRERTLEIMRDSRIGSHGAAALVLVVLLKIAALSRLLEGDGQVWLAAPVWARFLCTALMALFPYARSQGLGSVFAGRVGARELAIGALAVALAGRLLWPGPSLAWAAVGSTATALVLALWFQRRLGGLTGDGYGAAIELSEATCLVVLSLR